MGKRWIETAVIGACLALAAQVQAQGWPGYGECAPSASGGGGGGGDFMPGPMRPPLAPPGPSSDLSISADAPNAFDPYCGKPRPDYCCNGMWIDAGALGWALRNPHFSNPLLTGGGTGVPGTPGVGILIDENSLHYHYFVGAQAEMGFWLNSGRTIAFEADGFVIEKNGATLSYGPTGGNPQLFVPTQVGGAVVAQAVDPAELQAASRLWGVDANLMCIGCCCGCDIALLTGYGYRDLMESVDFNIGLPAAVAGPDHFRTRNQLSGSNLGLRWGGVGCSGLFFGAQAMITVGNNHETAVLAGDTAGVPGGFFVTAANAGRFTQNEFSYASQADLKIGYQLNRYSMVYAGYTFLYWRNVIRPGELIPATPGNAVVLDQVNFWAQGINLGFELRF